MNESFARLVDPIVRYVLDTQRRIVAAGTGHPALDEVHDDLLALFKKSRAQATSLERLETISTWPNTPSCTGPTKC